MSFESLGSELAVPFKIPRIIKSSFLLIALIPPSIHGMENSQNNNQGKIGQLLEIARENSGKILLASSVATAAMLGYQYWPSIKKIISHCFEPYTVTTTTVVHNGSVIINGRVMNDNATSDGSNWQYEEHAVHRIPLHEIQDVLISNVNGDIGVNTNVRLAHADEELRISEQDMKQLKGKETYFKLLPSDFTEDIRKKYLDKPELIVSITKKAATELDLSHIRATINLCDKLVRIGTDRDSTSVQARIVYELKIPKNYPLKSLLMHTNHGSMTVLNTSKLLQLMRCQTNHGDICLNTIKNARTEAETACGSIIAENILHEFYAKNMHGNISAKKIGDAELRTNNGDISAEDISATNFFNACSANGPISVKSKLFNCKKATLSATNGDIKLAASKFNAKVCASISNGEVKSDFPLNNAKGSATNFTAEIGNPVSELNVFTSNGDAVFKKI